MNFLEALGLFSAIAGPLALIDLFLGDRAKATIAEYVFGFRNVSFGSFETSVVRGLMGFVMTEQRLSKKKVFLRFTLLIGTLTCLISVNLIAFTYNPTADLYGSVSDYWALASIGIAFVVLSPIAFIFDYISLRITYTLFIKRTPKFPISALLIVVDIVLSLIVTWAVLLPLGFSIDEFNLEVMSDLEIIIFLTMTMLLLISFTSLTLSVAQIVSLFIGTMARAIMISTRMNTVIALKTEIYRYPFAFIGILAGLTTVGIVALT